MNLKLIVAFLMISILIAGCQPAEEELTPEQADTGYEEQPPAVEENIVVPSHEPAPQEEMPSSESMGLLNEFKKTIHYLNSHPEIGETVTGTPRKVEIIFNYPLTKGTEIKLWDKTQDIWFQLQDTIIADTDSLVAIAYVEQELNPGIYKVTYKAVFASKEEEGPQEGFYYFEIE
ncbi:copper resistance protein CopC [Candidatus Woesearchaeota archaeon]|nr:copper resistance protein CopC [Candidatus Woesearchaeota archaeon]